MRKCDAVLAFLLLGGAAYAEDVDHLTQTGLVDAGVYITGQDAGAFQNDDLFSVCFFLRSDESQTNHLFWIGRDDSFAQSLIAIDVSSSVLRIMDAGNARATAVAALENGTWYSACLRNTGSGNVVLSYYALNGTLVEDLTGTDAGNNSITGADQLAMAWGGFYDPTQSGVDDSWAGDFALMAVWLEDIGDSGADAYAADPLNYMQTTNPPDWFRAADADGDISIVTTLQDQSGSGRHFTVQTTTVSEDGGPTVTDLSAETSTAVQRRRRMMMQ